MFYQRVKGNNLEKIPREGLRYLHDIPIAAAKKPTKETLSALRIALHNCRDNYECRKIAKAMASFAKDVPGLADEFLEIIKSHSNPGLIGAALHALTLGWPSHPTLSSILYSASLTQAKEIRYEAILSRFTLGERSDEIRDALVDFCRETNWLWPWEEDIVIALVTGWPHNSQLRDEAISGVRRGYYPQSWRGNSAMKYLLLGCPGDDAVASMLANQLEIEDSDYSKLDITEFNQALLSGFTGHPILIPAAEAWVEKNAATHHSPLDISVIAKLGGTTKCRKALIDWLLKGRSMPAWVISTLLDMSEKDDSDVHSAITDYISDKERREHAVRWLPDIISDYKELSVMLREILNGAHVFESCCALEILVKKEGRDAPDLWPLVEKRLNNDEGGLYWRLGHPYILKIWPERTIIRQLTKTTIYDEDTSFLTLYEVYGEDPEIRPLLDSTMSVLHEDLRFDFARSIEPMVRRGVPAAVTLASMYKYEKHNETRTITARAFARACLRENRNLSDLIEVFSKDLTNSMMGRDVRRQASAAALLELGRADILDQKREYGKPLNYGRNLKGAPNREFIAAVVEHWECLVESISDVWDRFNHSSIIASELAKAGKRAHALGLTKILEESIRIETQLDFDDVEAIIALHGRSVRLRDLFIDRLSFLSKKNSMMEFEKAAYAAMVSYLVEHFGGNEDVGQAFIQFSTSSLIRNAAFLALCQAWPDSKPVVEAIEKLPELINSPDPSIAWLFSSKADPQLMTKYLMSFPDKFKHGKFGKLRDGITNVRNRLQWDQECRNLLFMELKIATDSNTQIFLVKLLAPSMHKNMAFRTWVSDRLRATREDSHPVNDFTFDIFTYTYKPIKFAFLEALLTRY